VERTLTPSCKNQRYSLAIALALGFLIRLVILPITYGEDYAMFMEYGRLLATGKLTTLLYDDVFFLTTPPFYIYLMSLMRVVSDLGGMSLVFLGKLPNLISDLVVSYVIWELILKKTSSVPKALFGMSFFLFNPLVIYNSCFYGRFDSVALAFLMLAIRGTSWLRFGIYYGISIATKTFPLFLFPWFFKNIKDKKISKLAVSLVTVAVLCAPFLMTDAIKFIQNNTAWYLTKIPRHFSWQLIFVNQIAEEKIIMISIFFLMSYYALLFLLPQLSRVDVYEYAALVFSIFILFSMVVYEQYLTWQLPFLAVSGVLHKRRYALPLLYYATFIGAFGNGHINLLTPVAPIEAWNLVLGALILLFSYSVLRKG